MKKLTELLDKIVKYNDMLTSFQLIKEILSKYEAEISDMNAEQQLYEKGVNALGVDIMSYKPYRPRTIEYKKAMHQPYDRVTLRDTGEFESSFFVTFNKEDFIIDATDEKTKKLKKKYGVIFGLTEENREEITKNYLFPDLLDKTKKMIYA